MTRDVVEVLSPFGHEEAVHRMKFESLIRLEPGGYRFIQFAPRRDPVAAVLINSLRISPDEKHEYMRGLRNRAQHAVIMLFIADFDRDSIEKLRRWADVVDVFLVPTQEMRNFIQLFTSRPVEVLIDPIDFQLTTSVRKPAGDGGILKVVWFGYPQSYPSSMGIYGEALRDLHNRGEIEYHVVTKSVEYGSVPGFIVHEYVAESFPSLLQTFEVSVLSHYPLDFSMSTYWKSENKAVLAINRGLPVIASRTPAYERLLKKCGLEEYLFNSVEELVSAIRKLKQNQERIRYLDLSQQLVLEDYSCRKMAEDWLELYCRFRKNKS